jgi:hypothetical protein
MKIDFRACAAILPDMRLALLLVLAAAPAYAGVPEKGEGTITLLGGARLLVPGNGAYIDEQFATHKSFQPGGFASFGYQYDDELHFRIDLGYMVDHYRNPAGDLEVRSIPILLGLDTVLWRTPSLTLYGGGGIGYSLNTGSRGGLNNEANSTAGYLALGLRIRLGGPAALVVEDRFTLASAQVDAAHSTQSLNVGGNFFSLGLMFHFLQPEEKSYTPTR